MTHRVSPLSLLLLLALLGCGRARETAPAASLTKGGLQVEVSTTAPFEEGANELRVRVRDEKGAPVDDARVSLDYAMEMAGMAPMTGRADAERSGSGEYLARPELAMRGTWQVSLAVERPSGAAARLRGTLRTGSDALELETEPAPSAGGVTRLVRVAPERLQKIGVRFAEVERARVERTIRALGRVTWDETKLVDVTLKVPGFVRELRADALGARVTKGERLFSVYSPELYAAQTEYLAARASGDEALARAARARLRLWDVAAPDVSALEKRGTPLESLPVRAPASGVLVEKNVVEGGAFEAGAKLFRIAPLDVVWIEAQVYGSDLPLVAVGQRATLRSPYLPGRELDAKVAYVLPSLASDSRTASVRLELANPDLALRPEMLVDVELRADLGERVVVPASAVVVSGERRVVFVDRGEGVLEPRAVETGVTSDERVEVVRGLEPGERVVASGNFLIAAESRVQSALEQW